MRVRLGAPVAVALAVSAGCARSGEAPPDAGQVDPAATALHEERAPSTEPRDAGAAPHPLAIAPSMAPGVAPAAAASADRPDASRPLAEWMRDAATRAFNSGDLETIAGAFEQMAAWAPPGYANWTSIASDGSDAARAGSIEGVKAACRGCHTQYEAQYRATLASRRLSSR